MKRVLLINKARHIETLGGVAFFNNSLCKLLQENDYIVDICTEKQLKQNNWKYTNKCKIIFAEGNYNSTFSNKIHFYDNTNVLELDFMLQMQKSITKALFENYYDFILINSEECLLPMLDLQKFYNLNKHKIFYYMHRVWSDSKDMSMFRKELNSFLFKHLNVIIPQSEMKKSLNLENAAVLPLLTNENKSENHIKNDKTVLFNGRWADEKKPKEFIKFIKENNFIPYVITNSTGVEKFKEEFKNLKEYYIYTGVFGKEKIDILGKCQFLFHPSETETISYAVLEALRNKCIPIVDKKHRWAKDHCYSDKMLDMNDEIVYVDKYVDYFEGSGEKWLDFLNNLPVFRYETKTKIKHKIENLEYAIKYRDLMKERDILCDDDLCTLTKLVSSYKIENDELDTWIYKDEFVKEESNDLFF